MIGNQGRATAGAAEPDGRVTCSWQPSQFPFTLDARSQRSESIQSAWKHEIIDRRLQASTGCCSAIRGRFPTRPVHDREGLDSGPPNRVQSGSKCKHLGISVSGLQKRTYSSPQIFFRPEDMGFGVEGFGLCCRSRRQKVEPQQPRSTDHNQRHRQQCV